MKWIGLTGGIATGKSTVTKIIQDLGGAVVDADVLAREVVGPGSFGLEGLIQVFGPGVLKSRSGTGGAISNSAGGAAGKEKDPLDREALGAMIFSDPEKKRWLENLLHPLIQWRAQQEKLILERSGAQVAFYDAALIYEKNLSKNFDKVIVVSCTSEQQLERLIKRNGLSSSEAKKRLSVQMPPDEKVRLADEVIDNSGSLASTRDQVERLLRKL